MSSSVARSVTQIGFTIAGNAIGGPIGGAIGSALGAAIAYELFPPDPVKGPRLADLKAQVSSYGGNIPRAWGTVRMAGNVIWASDLIETEKTEEAGGKGGGPEVTTYSYSIDCAVGMCVGPIAGIRKIWADTELVYDVSDQADIEAQQASGEFRQYFTLYTGSDTQLPDATMETALGAGNVPGYRGLAYVVFTGLPLERYGNRLPNLEFEVMVTATTAAAARSIAVSVPAYSGQGILFPAQGVVRLGSSADNLVRTFSLNGTAIGIEQRSDAEAQWPLLAVPGEDYGIYGLVDGAQLFHAPPSGATIAYVRIRLSSGGVIDCGGFFSGLFIRGVVPCVDGKAFLVALHTAASGTPTTWVMLEFDSDQVRQIRSGTISTPAFWAGIAVSGSTAQDNKYDCCVMEGDRLHLWALSATAGGAIVRARIENDGSIVQIESLSTSVSGFIQPSIHADNGYCWVILNTTLNVFHGGGALTPGAPTLSTVVQGVCTAAGYAGADLNTVALTDTVDGYALSQSSTARGALEQLRASFFFDVVESDGTVKFVKRGGAAVATITVDELGVIDQPGPLTVQRAQETELPSRINVAYLAADADYQVGTQSARRETTGSRSVQDVQLAVAMTDLRAAQIADVLLTDAWLARESRSAVAPAEYAYIEPTDVVQIVDTDGTVFTCRVTETKLAGQRVDLTLVDDRAAMYTSQAVAGVTPGGQVLALEGPTGLHALDLPPLRDADNDAGLYYAAWGYTSAWRGAQVFIRNDSRYEASAAVLNAARVGACLTTLGDHGGGNTFDERNVLQVQVNGTLSSVTRTEALAGLNAAVVGDEVIVFRTASLVSAGVYNLSGLLRGRLGTERFIATHAAAERFVLLTSTTIERGPVNYARLGEAIEIKAVTLGAALAESSPRALTFECASLRPLAPAYLRCVPQPGGDLVFRWVRRGRLAAGWNNNADVPLGEASEQYVIELSSGGAIRRTATVSAPTFTYTASQRLADGTGDAGTVSASAFQVSALVGRGFAAQDSFSVPGADATAIRVLLHLNGTNGSTTIIDTSLSPRTFTTFGGCSIATAQSVFGGASLSFNGTTGYLAGTSVPTAGTADWTLEFRFRTNAVAAPQQTLFENRGTVASTATGWMLFISTTGGLQLYSGAADRLSGTPRISANTWYAVAVVRSGSSVLVYLDGMLIDTWAGVTANFTDTRFEFGRSLINTEFLNGFIDEVRWTIGIARYTGPSYAVASTQFADPTL